MYWLPIVPDRPTSRALLVGTATYTNNLPQLPHVYDNLADLSDALTGEAGILDPNNVQKPITDPSDASMLLQRLAALAEEKTDLLLFYFAGHGLRDSADELCLGLPGSRDNHGDARRTSVPVEDLFRVFKHSRAMKRVAIIDCCYSGLAADAAARANTHLLAATSKTKKALYKEGRNTEFTGALLRLLAEGIPDGPEYLDLSSIYQRLTVTLRSTGLPPPSQCTINSSGETALARNVAHGSANSRAGLRSRALFAQQIATVGRFEHAARLWEGIVADASNEYSAVDLEVLRYRHAHASCVGNAGNPAKAIELLNEVIADLSLRIPDNAPALTDAHTSHDYWITRPWR